MGLQLSPSGGSRWEASDSGLLESGRAVIITFYFPEVGEHMPVGWRFALLYSLLLARTSHHLGAAQESRGWDDPLPWSTRGLPSLDNWTAGNKARKKMRLGWCHPTRLPSLLPRLPCSGGSCCTMKCKSSEHRNHRRERAHHTHSAPPAPRSPLPALAAPASCRHLASAEGRTLALDSRRSRFSSFLFLINLFILFYLLLGCIGSSLLRAGFL